MKKWYIITGCIMLTYASCQMPVAAPVETPTIVVVPDSPTQATPEIDNWQDDPRLSAVDAADTKWIRKPGGAARGISAGDPITGYCNEPGWAYIFYDDQAVIGYEPFPNAVSVMHEAVKITVESHNMEFPDKAWDFINVSLTLPPPAIISNDPVLEAWQCALVLDDGTIAEFYQAEFDFEWYAWKGGTMANQLFLYNRDHDPDAHIVWGPDK